MLGRTARGRDGRAAGPWSPACGDPGSGPIAFPRGAPRQGRHGRPGLQGWRPCSDNILVRLIRLVALLTTLPAIAMLVATSTAHAAPAKDAALVRYPAVGFGEQRSAVFTNPFWQDLGLKRTRFVVGWDALRSRWQTAEVDAWMAAARAAGAKPLIAFTRSRSHWRTKVLPSKGEYKKAFRAFRHRYPDVTDYLVWNEANHCSQPLCHRPDRAAAYFDAMVEACRRCTIVAADVLDTPSMAWYLREFRRHARHTPRIWGLHNYIDANRLQSTGTRTMLRTVRGSIWFTETGGLVDRSTSSPIKFPQSVAHQARAVKFVLQDLALLSPRIRRIYLYHFQYQGTSNPWDSGVLSPHGRPRVAYRVIARWVKRVQAARRAALER